MANCYLKQWIISYLKAENIIFTYKVADYPGRALGSYRVGIIDTPPPPDQRFKENTISQCKQKSGKYLKLQVTFLLLGVGTYHNNYMIDLYSAVFLENHLKDALLILLWLSPLPLHANNIFQKNLRIVNIFTILLLGIYCSLRLLNI